MKKVVSITELNCKVKPIKDIEVGEYVQTNTGLQKVTRKYLPHELPKDGVSYLQLTFDDGHSVKCTNTHKFLMEYGLWVEAGDIEVGEMFADSGRTLVGVVEVEPFDLYDITVENDHCFRLANNVIAHNRKTVFGGGTGTLNDSDSVFVLGRQQEKDGSDIVGFNIMMTIEKSRYCREKSVFPIELRYEGGMNKWSGLLDIAIDIGFVVKPSNGWFCRVIDGVIEEQKWRRKDTNSAEYWNVLLNSNEFNAAVEKRFRVAVGKMYQDDSSTVVEDEEDALDTEYADS